MIPLAGWSHSAREGSGRTGRNALEIHPPPVRV